MPDVDLSHLGEDAADALRLVAVHVERQDGSPDEEPVSLFLRGATGQVELFSLSLSSAHRTVEGHRGLRRLLARVTALRRASGAGPVSAPARDLLTRTCAAVLDVLEALGATGRRRLTARQRDLVEDARRTLRDLGVRTGERALDPLLDEQVTTAAVLRAQLVLARAASLAGSAGSTGEAR